MNICGIILGNTVQPADISGCILENGHSGCHEYHTESWGLYCWETDWECDCDWCETCQGDYCVVYWPKERTL